MADLLDSRFLYDQKIINEDCDLIDSWVILEIERRGLNGKKDAYKEVISELSKKLQLSKNLSPQEKINRLSTLLKKAVEDNKLYSKMGIDLQSLEKIYGV